MGGEVSQSGPPTQSDGDLVGILVGLGLCLTCLAGLLFLLVVVGLIIIRRKK
jgi:hypothetical protein